MSLYAKDAQLITTAFLPNGTTTAYTTGIDMGLTVRGELSHLGEFDILAPALTTTQLPNAATMTYAVVVGTNNTFTTPTLVYDNVLIQTGAGGTGAASVGGVRFRLPISPGGIGNSNTFVGVRMTNSGTSNASAASLTLSFEF
jgi:hypothetical protein